MAADNDREARQFRHPDARELSDDVPSSRRYDDNSAGPLGAPDDPPRRRRLGLGRILKWTLLLALIGLVAYAIYIVQIVAKISTNSWQFTPLSADGSGRTNILVLGVGDPGHAGQELSDTVMVVSLDKSSGRIAQVSLPRDLRVSIPGYGVGKINSANAKGGVQIAEETVANTLGIPIDYYLTTNFSGLKGVVDAVGGLDIEVKERLVDTEYPCEVNQYKGCGLVIEPGMQRMDGARVLQYVRCRKGTCGNDFGRAERQQEVIDLLRPKLADPTLLLHPGKLRTLAGALQQGIKTDLGLIQLVQLGNRWRTDATNDPVRLVLSTGPGGYLRGDPNGSSDLLPVGGSFEAVSGRVKNIFTTPSQGPANGG